MSWQLRAGDHQQPRKAPARKTAARKAKSSTHVRDGHTPVTRPKAGLVGTLKQNIIETLKMEGPLTSMALASRLYDKGWRSRTATTDQKRTGTVGTMLAMLRLKEKLVEPVSDDEHPKRWVVSQSSPHTTRGRAFALVA